MKTIDHKSQSLSCVNIKFPWLTEIWWTLLAVQGPEFEAKVAKLVELGFGREAVIQALKLFDGNEEQAAGFLFGGWRDFTFKIG